MAKEWIDSLAQEIKQKDHQAAEEYGRAQHYAGIITAGGDGFFISLVQCLEDDVAALKSRLQGDLTSSETAIQKVKAGDVKITRARFPWIDAHVFHREDHIVLDYAKAPGAAEDPTLDRKITNFAFKVAPDDALYVEDSFAGQPRRYNKPEELSQSIVEMLFTP